MVHLGRNPISAKGWEEFKNVFIDEDTATGAGQGNRFFFYHMKTQTGIYLTLNSKRRWYGYLNICYPFQAVQPLLIYPSMQ